MEFSLTEFVPVTEGVFTAVAEPESVNVGLVIGEQSALLVDTGSTPAQGREIRARAQALAGTVPITDVVVTHAHHDHLFGLAAFDDVATWGHRNLAEELRTAPPTDERVVLPQRTFSLAATVDLGGLHVELVHFGRGHTSSDVVVLVPGRGVVFAGDLLESSAFPSVGPDSFLADWPRTLDGTLGTLRSHSRVVPGHGPVMDQPAAFIQRAELAWLEGQLGLLWDNGTDPSDVWESTDQWPCTQAEAEATAAVRFAQYAAAGRPRRRTLPLLGR